MSLWANIKINPNEEGTALRADADDTIHVEAEKNGINVVDSDLLEVGGPDSLVFSDGETTVTLSVGDQQLQLEQNDTRNDQDEMDELRK